jgi:hypothetical protein
VTSHNRPRGGYPVTVLEVDSDELRLHPMSDLHFGNNACDTRKIAAELAAADHLGQRIVINGDVFDAVMPSDRRSTPGRRSLVTEGLPAPLSQELKEGVEFLTPYAGSIDLIGQGNHETDVEKKAGINLIAGRVV